MKADSSKALLVAAGVAAVALGEAVWLDVGKCDGFVDWVQHAQCGFEDDTIWSEGYSEAGFKQILPGMTGEDVVRLVGRPMVEWWDGEGSECLGRHVHWEYAWSGEAGWVRLVYFEEDGRGGRTVHYTVRSHWPD